MLWGRAGSGAEVPCAIRGLQSGHRRSQGARRVVSRSPAEARPWLGVGNLQALLARGGTAGGPGHMAKNRGHLQ